MFLTLLFTELLGLGGSGTHALPFAWEKCLSALHRCAAVFNDMPHYCTSPASMECIQKAPCPATIELHDYLFSIQFPSAYKPVIAALHNITLGCTTALTMQVTSSDKAGCALPAAIPGHIWQLR